jgi:hypothetical protein
VGSLLLGQLVEQLPAMPLEVSQWQPVSIRERVPLAVVDEEELLLAEGFRRK